MGTNYYVVTSSCSCCKRMDKIHLGKFSVGWTFHFRGYLPGDSPLGRPIVCERDWREVTALREIINEYDEYCSFDEFWATVEKLKERHALAKVKNHSEIYKTNGNWNDAAGNSFSSDEFS